MYNINAALWHAQDLGDYLGNLVIAYNCSIKNNSGRDSVALNSLEVLLHSGR